MKIKHWRALVTPSGPSYEGGAPAWKCMEEALVASAAARLETIYFL